MSQIFETEKFLEDANAISVFFRDKFRNLDYLCTYFTYFVPQISQELCNQSYRVLQIKNSNARVLRLYYARFDPVVLDELVGAYKLGKQNSFN